MTPIPRSFARAALLAWPLFAASPAAARLPQDAPTFDGSAVRHALRAGDLIEEAFSLDDIFGNRVELLGGEPGALSVKGGIISVIVFWSLHDPVARGYVPKLTAIQADYADRKVVVYLIDSNHDEIWSAAVDPLEKIRGYVKKEGVTLPILVDPANRIADQFGSICAGEAFVVGFDRRVKFVGAIDDDPRGKHERAGRDPRRWVRRALDAVLRSHPVETPYVRPRGRPLKRAPSK